MARLYTNENFPLPAARRLRLLGHDVLTTQDAGNADRALADEEVVDFAIREERVVVTLNRRHFVRLHRERPDHRGIIVCTFDPEFEDLADRIDRKIRAPGDLSGVLIRVERI